jgi:Mg-chelatase subunit ChlD
MELTTAQKWRLILGKGEQQPKGDTEDLLKGNADLQAMDEALEQLYDGEERKGGLGSSSPRINRWLGDIRKYFPTPVVQVMQQDALERLGLKQMLLEPELLASIEADINLVATLITLNKAIPQKTKETARMVVKKVVDDLIKKLQNPVREAVMGALSKSVRNYRPRLSEIDWHSTIRRNLRHYQPDYQTIIPQQVVGFGRKGQALREVILCIDQSGSMASSVVYSSVFGAVLASLPALRTQMVVFDTEVADLTKDLKDPVDLLFGTQLGGGTDIDKALAYVEKIIGNPSQTILVVVSDLYEGGNAASMLRRFAALQQAGVQCIVLLALDDKGAPSYDRRHAEQLSALGMPVFACTPDHFASLMAAAIQKRDLRQWLEQKQILSK